MLKVAIVDDELIFREYLRTMVDWEAIGFQVSFEARNGVDALEMFEKYKPHVMLVDINMPFMDGLQLSEKIKEDYPDTAIILITGYNEFEYARKAIKINVLDYILKPFEKGELIKLLLKIKETFKIKNEGKLEKENDLKLIRESMFNTLISRDRNLEQEDVLRQMETLGMPAKSQKFQVAVIEIDNIEEAASGADDRAILRYAVANMLGELSRVKGNKIIFHSYEGKIVSIIEAADNSSCKEDFDLDKYWRLCITVKNYLKQTVTVGVGQVYEGYNCIFSSYMEAVSALNNKFLLGSDKVIQYEKAIKEYCNMGFYPSDINEDLLVNLRIKAWDKIEEKLNSVFRYIYDNKLSLDYTYSISMGLVSLCMSYIVESGGSISDIFGDNFFPFNEIRDIKSIKDLHAWTADIFNRTVKYGKENKTSKARKIVQSAREYIESNYNNSLLSVEEVAQSLYINSSYLRAIFKKELGMTVTDYITNIRMGKAKELLSMGNIRFSEISSLIGYSDASYFSKCFKRYFGINPSEYENRRK